MLRQSVTERYRNFAYLQINQSNFNGIFHKIHRGLQSQLPVHIGAVNIDRFSTDIQGMADLLIPFPLGYHSQHLLFPGGQMVIKLCFIMRLTGNKGRHQIRHPELPFPGILKGIIQSIKGLILQKISLVALINGLLNKEGGICA